MRADITAVVFDQRSSRLARDVVFSLSAVGVTPEEIRFSDSCPEPICDFRRGLHTIADPKLDIQSAARQLRFALRGIADRLGQKILLFPSDDLHLNMFVEGELEFEPYMCSVRSGQNRIRDFLDKGAFFKSIRDLNVPKPETVCITTSDEIEQAAIRLKYPCIIKPARKDVLNCFYRLYGKKALTLESAAAFVALESQLAELPPTGFVLQQKISGGVGNEYSCGGIRYPDGQLQTFCVRRIRQNPGGTGTYAETVVEPELSNIARQVTEYVDYAGIFELDCMRSDQDGRFTIMEFNPRVWQQYRVGECIGINLPALAFNWFSGRNAEVSHPGTLRAEWIDLEEDFFVSVVGSEEGHVLTRAWNWCARQRCLHIAQLGRKRASCVAPWRVAIRELLLRPIKVRIRKLFRALVANTSTTA